MIGLIITMSTSLIAVAYIFFVELIANIVAKRTEKTWVEPKRMLEQNVYRLTEYGAACLLDELETFHNEDFIEVGSCAAIQDEWFIEVIDVEDDNGKFTWIIVDESNFLNENFADPEYLKMVEHEEHLVEKWKRPVCLKPKMTVLHRGQEYNSFQEVYHNASATKARKLAKSY